MTAGAGWSTQQLAEFLAVVSSFPDEPSAVLGAVERAAEALEAEVGAFIQDKRVAAVVGFAADDVPEAELVRIALNPGSAIVLPDGLECRPLVVPVDDDPPGQLLLARAGEDFSREEAGLVRAMARVLALALGNRRLVVALQKRQGLVEEASAMLAEREDRLRRSELFLQSVVENIPSMVFAKDAAELRFVLFNKAGEELVGYSHDDMIGKNDHDFFPTEEADFFTDKDRRVLESRQLLDIAEESIQTRYRGVRTLHTSKVPILDEHGTPQYLLGISEDITERKEAERALAESEERFRQLADNIDEVFFLRTVEPFEFLYLSPAVEAVYGISSDEAYRDPMSFLALAHPEDLQRVGEEVAGNASRGGRGELEYRILRRDGDVRWVRVRTAPARIEEGKVTRIAGTVEDITDRKGAEIALRDAEEAAARASQAKSEFLSRTSHELRTPLNAVIGFSELLRLEGLDADQLDSVEHIHKAGRHLLTLINEVLDLSRIETGDMSLSVEPVAVGEVIVEALDLVRPMATQAGVALGLNPLGGRHYARADHHRLKQVVLNLLSNAIKYNRRGGAADVSLEITGADELRIDVTDTGRGIDPEQLDRLFTPFDRLGAEGGDVEGTGLGLALSQQLTHAMGGRLEVTSLPGHGSTFSVVLQLAEGIERSFETYDRESTPADSPKGRVLYVEDNPANVILVERILALRPGIEFLTAVTGSLGIDLARGYRPDLILLDLNLPDLSGDTVLARLRADPSTAAIPVAVVSADATAGHVERLRAAGAHDYLIKPFAVAELLRLIDDVLVPMAIE